MAIEAYSMRARVSAAAGATSLSSRAVARAGVARTTASACTTSGSRVEPTTRFQPPSGRRARSRTVAPVRTVAPEAVATAPGSRPTPPRRPAKTGTSLACPGVDIAAAAARLSERSRSQQRHHLGYGGPGGDLAGVAGVHAAEQWLHQPVDDLLAQALLDQVADADVAIAELGGRQHAVHGRAGETRGRDDTVEGAEVDAGRPSSCAATGPDGPGSTGSPPWWPGAPGPRPGRRRTPARQPPAAG